MMSWPTFHIAISGSLLAAYAAVLSTLTGIVQVCNYFRDRARIKVVAQPNMEMYGDPKYQGKKWWIIKVANLGRRPVTITAIGANRKIPADPFIITDCHPQLPHELTEGKSMMAILEKDAMDFSKILWWHATDAVGNEYRSQGGHWLARKKLYRGWRKEAARELKAKTTDERKSNS